MSRACYDRSAMDLKPRLLALSSSCPAVMALPLAVGDDDSGSRTIVGTIIVLASIAVVVGIGLAMTSGGAKGPSGTR